VLQHARRHFLIGSRDSFRERQISSLAEAQPRKRELGFSDDKKTHANIILQKSEKKRITRTFFASDLA